MSGSWFQAGRWKSNQSTSNHSSRRGSRAGAGGGLSLPNVSRDSDSKDPRFVPVAPAPSEHIPGSHGRAPARFTRQSGVDSGGGGDGSDDDDAAMKASLETYLDDDGGEMERV